MSIYIRESLNGDKFYVDWHYNNPVIDVKEDYTNNADALDPDSLMVDIEGIHQYPVYTRNFTRYREQALLSSIPTWTKPYLRPLILHHNEKDGKIIGRIRNVQYKRENTLSKTPALLFTVNIPDKDGKEGVLDGRLKTVSIGAIVHDCRCSICGQNIAEDGECEHERGQKYNGEICYWDIYSMEAKELSYVIVPSDVFAQNIKIYKPVEKDFKESFKKGVMAMSENANLNEDKNIDEEIKVDEKPADSEDKKELEKLKSENESLKKDLSSEKEKTKAAAEQLADTAKTIEKLKNDLKAAEDSLALKDADMVKEKQLRESLEENLKSKTKELRESLESKFTTLKLSLGKPVSEKTDLSMRTDESLRDAVHDLEEEFALKNKLNIIEKTENPGIVDVDDDNKIKPEIKENTDKNLNIDLEETLQNLMSSMMK